MLAAKIAISYIVLLQWNMFASAKAGFRIEELKICYLRIRWNAGEHCNMSYLANLQFFVYSTCQYFPALTFDKSCIVTENAYGRSISFGNGIWSRREMASNTNIKYSEQCSQLVRWHTSGSFEGFNSRFIWILNFINFKCSKIHLWSDVIVHIWSHSFLRNFDVLAIKVVMCDDSNQHTNDANNVF